MLDNRCRSESLSTIGNIAGSHDVPPRQFAVCRADPLSSEISDEVSDR
jgi:hypothetical protein